MNTKNKIVVYTAVTGGYDNLLDPECITPGVDYICFTDNTSFKSDVWQFRPITERDKEFTQDDPVRLARRFKLLPHDYLSDYEYSIWMDANLLIKADIRPLIAQGLAECDFATWEMPEKVICTYKQAEALKKGDYDNPETIDAQMLKYRRLGFPENNANLDTKGVMSCVLVRRHMSQNLMLAMDDWWSELALHSRRDQLSFHFIAWKNNLKYYLFSGDARNNEYFQWRRHDSKIDKLRELGKSVGSDILKNAKGRNIYLWGTGSASTQTEDILPNIEIKAYLDSNPSKQGSLHNGKPVLKPEQDNRFWSDAYVIIASSYVNEIAAVLENNLSRESNADFSRGISDELIGLVNLKD